MNSNNNNNNNGNKLEASTLDLNSSVRLFLTSLGFDQLEATALQNTLP
jgi:hypothetical protein